MMGRNLITLFLSFLFLISMSCGESDLLLNGTSIYLSTGDSYGLYQGYILGVKSVSSDGSVWLQLIENDTIIKSEIIVNNGYFIYNKTNRTILSVRVDNVYSGSPEQNLVSLFPVYQFIDPDMPAPDITEIIPEHTRSPGNYSPVRIHTPGEPVIWTVGIVFILILFYMLRKLW
jgi:hypothetical protein